ncbi:MAG: hypothetical protein ACREV7_02385 [Steroidobacteraceae bacterium]
MGSPAASQNATTLLARSAQLTLTATPTDDALALRIARVSGQRLIVGPGQVTATLDGRRVPLGAEPNGAWLLSLHGQRGGAHSLSVVVTHDGIRELLSGTVTAPPHRSDRSALDFFQSHGMFAWWVLNIAVVLIAVLVISRHRR